MSGDQTLLMRGTRVLLRHPGTADKPLLLELHRRSRSLHRPWAYPALTPAGIDAYLKRCHAPDFCGLLVCLHNQPLAIAGVINLSQIFPGNFRSAYTGYYASADMAGNGYMTQGLHLAVRYAFKTLKLHRLEANIQPGNTASIALAQRCNFVKEGFSRRYLKVGGRWRDHERWAVVV